MKRLALLLFLFLIFLFSAACAAPPERPNLLWIIAEDFSPDLGCYGNPLVYTPNLDHLAEEGVRYTHAFVTAPVCSPSRSAIAVGMYQTSVGAHQHRSHRTDGYRLPEGIHVFTHYLKQAGYHTSNLTDAVPGARGTGKTDFNFNLEDPFEATDWSRREPGQPFYAQINFSETHRAFHRFPQRPVDPSQVQLPPYYPDHPAVRLDWALYLETAQNLDAKVGKVLQHLEREGLADDTIVFFFSDHGRPMPRGKQFLYEGGIRIPLIVRIPEKFRPQGFVPGTVSSNLVSAIDITVTTLKLAGIEPPAHMQGRVFLGPQAEAREYIVAARDRCDETVDRIRCIRTRRYKYIRNFLPERAWTQGNIYKDTAYPPLRVMRDLEAAGKLTPEQARFMAPTRPPEELYDLEADPHELNNLASIPQQQATLEKLRGLLEDWIRESADGGEIPEERLPEEYDYRTRVDDWSTHPFSRVEKAGGLMRVICEGKRGDLRRSFVTAGGELAVQFRARSREIRELSVYWGSIAHMQRNRDETLARVDFVADGKWREYEIPIPVDPGDFLAQLGFDFGEARGTIEFDSIRLLRQPGHTEARWDFN